jgi:hypothetical protein
MRHLHGAILSILLLGAWQPAHAQLAAWETDGLAGNEATFAATTSAANLTIGDLTRGAGLNPTALANAFSSSNFLNTGLAGAQSGNKYLQFSITAVAGWQVSLSTLDANFRRSGTGPDAFQWQYSFDGFATAGVNAGAEISYTTTPTSGAAQAQIDLGAIPALQNVPAGTTITFRLFGWGASGTGGTFAIGRLAGDDLAIGGTVEPSGGPTCGITLGAANATCNSQTPGPGNDTYDLSIPYTGVDAAITVINNSGSGSIGGDDPAVVSNGTIVISGISEDDAYSINFSSPCNALTVSGAAPSCEPPFPGTTISFDEDLLWTGAGSLTSYSTDHAYEEADWFFTGGPALRNGIATQDGFPGALGTFSWRLQNVGTVDWRATYQGGDILENFGFSVRRWDDSPSPAFEVSYSTDGGASFSAPVAVINNAFLDNSSDWKVFSHTIASPAFVVPGQFVVRVASTGTTERIMVDDFTFETSPGPECPFALENIPNFDENTCACALGYFATITDIGGNDVITDCTICPPGSFCPDGIDAFECPAGRYQDQAGQTVCIDCDAGTFNATTGATACTACPAGTFNAVSGASSCAPCDAGFYNPTVGAISCLACDAGTFSDQLGAISCAACPAGTFSAVTGSVSCTPCEAGFANSITGQTECGACPPGSFSANSGQAECDLCPAGTFNPDAGQAECTACPSGESSGEGATECVPDGPCFDVTLEINTDLSGSQTSWEIADAALNITLCSGGPYADGFQLNITESCCLPEGCYALRVFDSAGDGILNGSNGGYQLRLASDNRRIIDNQRNGGFGSLSQITGNAYSFCVPIGDVEPLYTSCDKYWWRTGEYLVATPDDDVSAEWLDGEPNTAQSTTSGYEFWFYNPNGGYSFRRFRSHRLSDGFGPASAVRACHMKVNNWAVANHIPEFDLMNVRIRPRIQGVNGDWGAACRFVRDEALAQCPPTKLMDIPGNQFLSCGQFRQFGVPGQRIHSRPVAQATEYQWRFRIPAENIEIIRSSTGYFLNLNWGAAVAAPLEAGKTYEVDVRAFRNGAWCVDPLDPDSAWGDICLLTIQNTPAQGGSQNLALTGNGEFSLWPNPNSGDQFWINMDGIADDVLTVAVDIHDLTGKRVVAREIPTQGKHLYTVIDINPGSGPGQALANGVYLVSIMAGDKRYTERLIIAN